MKDQENKTNSLCYCKDVEAVKRLAIKIDDKEISAGKNIQKTNGDKAQPWSVLGELYWI